METLRRHSPLYLSLQERPLFMGVNRFTFVMNLGAAAFLIGLLHWYWWTVIFLILQVAMMMLFSRDPYLFEKYRAFSREADRYEPRPTSRLRQWARPVRLVRARP
jgi:type IV secretory pathway TrbD component